MQGGITSNSLRRKIELMLHPASLTSLSSACSDSEDGPDSQVLLLHSCHTHVNVTHIHFTFTKFQSILKPFPFIILFVKSIHTHASARPSVTIYFCNIRFRQEVPHTFHQRGIFLSISWPTLLPAQPKYANMQPQPKYANMQPQPKFAICDTGIQSLPS